MQSRRNSDRRSCSFLSAWFLRARAGAGAAGAGCPADAQEGRLPIQPQPLHRCRPAAASPAAGAHRVRYWTALPEEPWWRAGGGGGGHACVRAGAAGCMHAGGCAPKTACVPAVCRPAPCAASSCCCLGVPAPRKCGGARGRAPAASLATVRQQPPLNHKSSRRGACHKSRGGMHGHPQHARQPGEVRAARRSAMNGKCSGRDPTETPMLAGIPRAPAPPSPLAAPPPAPSGPRRQEAPPQAPLPHSGPPPPRGGRRRAAPSIQIHNCYFLSVCAIHSASRAGQGRRRGRAATAAAAQNLSASAPLRGHTRFFTYM